MLNTRYVRESNYSNYCVYQQSFVTSSPIITLIVSTSSLPFFLPALLLFPSFEKSEPPEKQTEKRTKSLFFHYHSSFILTQLFFCRARPWSLVFSSRRLIASFHLTHPLITNNPQFSSTKSNRNHCRSISLQGQRGWVAYCLISVWCVTDRTVSLQWNTESIFPFSGLVLCLGSNHFIQNNQNSLKFSAGDVIQNLSKTQK